MAEVKILDLADLPEEGTCKRVEFEHPVTEFPYQLGVYYVDGRYFVLTDECKQCNASLTAGKLNGLIVTCVAEDHPWNIRTGLLKYDRSRSIPVYRVQLRDDGIYIEI